MMLGNQQGGFFNNKPNNTGNIFQQGNTGGAVAWGNQQPNQMAGNNFMSNNQGNANGANNLWGNNQPNQMGGNNIIGNNQMQGNVGVGMNNMGNMNNIGMNNMPMNNMGMNNMPMNNMNNMNNMGNMGNMGNINNIGNMNPMGNINNMGNMNQNMNPNMMPMGPFDQQKIMKEQANIQYQNQIALVLHNTTLLQTQAQLLFLIKFLGNKQTQIANQMKKTITSQNLIKNKPIQEAQVVNRCRAMKTRNQQMLIQMLNLREKLVHLMHLSRQKTTKLVPQRLAINDKISQIKLQITNKCNFSKYNNVKVKPNKAIDTEQYAPVKIALTEMKKAAQVLERQSAKMREQLNLVVKHIHGTKQ